MNIVSMIDEYYENNYSPRNYLGLSQAGHDCPRWLWFKHNKYIEQPPKGRILRLLKLGNVIEDIVKKDIINVGFVLEREQEEITFTNNNITLKGHIDGILYSKEDTSNLYLWECKSIKKEYYPKVKKNGYENYNSQYKFQIHAYAFYLNLKKIYVTVYCKNDSEIHEEIIYTDFDWIKEELLKVFDIIDDKDLPKEGICPRKDFYRSKMCGYQHICWRN